MSTLAKAEIPDGINTLERLVAYSISALSRVNPDLRVIETAGTTTKACEISIVPADDGTTRFIARVSLELKSDYQTDTSQPQYMHVQELSNVAVPAAYKQV